MKTNRISFIATLLVILASCSEKMDSNPEIPEITGLTEDVYFEQVGQTKTMGLVEHYDRLLKEATENNADDTDYLNYIQEQLDSAKLFQQECFEQSGANSSGDGPSGNNRALGYQYTTIRYKSIGYDGRHVILSALVVWPFNTLIADPDANNVIIGCHCTIGSNKERPTNFGDYDYSIQTDVGMMACCAKTYGPGAAYENLVIIPDYQGFGATHGDVHPYLSQTLTARQVLDGVRAGIAFYQALDGHKLEKNWKSLSLGYSQGGSVAMAVHRYIEKNDLESEFNFAGSVCGNGPYDPLATLKKYVDDDKVWMPVSAAMMMYSMCETSHRLKGKHTIDKFLTQKFIDSDVIELIKAKEIDTDQMQQKLLDYSMKFDTSNTDSLGMWHADTDGHFHPYRKNITNVKWKSGYIKTAYARTLDLLTNDCYMYFLHGDIYRIDANKRAPIVQLEKALNDNVLWKNWTPEHPIFLYHTEEDEVVVVENFRNCLKAWEGSDMVKGAIYKGRTHTHVNYGKVFFMRTCSEGIKAIFNNKAHEYDFERIKTGTW